MAPQASLLFQDAVFCPAPFARAAPDAATPRHAPSLPPLQLRSIGRGAPKQGGGPRPVARERWPVSARGGHESVDSCPSLAPSGASSARSGALSARSDRAAAVIAKYGHEAAARWEAAQGPGPRRTAPQIGDRSERSNVECPEVLDCRLRHDDAFPIVLRGDDVLAAFVEDQRAALARCRRRRWDEIAARSRRRAQQRESRRPRHAPEPPAMPSEGSADLSDGTEDDIPETPGSLATVPEDGDGPGSLPGSRGASRPRATLLGAVPHKSTLDERMKTLRGLARTRRPTLALLEEANARTTASTLSPEQREQIQQAVARARAAEAGGALQEAQVRAALTELGHAPRSRGEKRLLAEVVARRAAEGGLGSVAELQEAVAEVMGAFQEEMPQSLDEHFRRYDPECVGAVPPTCIEQILADMSLEPRNADEKAAVLECLPKVVQQASAADVRPEQKKEQRRSSNSESAPCSPTARAPRRKLTLADLELCAAQPAAPRAPAPTVPFAEVERAVWQVREALGQLRQRRLRAIQAEVRAAPRIAEAMVDDLAELKDWFCATDASGRGRLTHQETRALLSDIGIRVRTAQQFQATKELLRRLDDGTGHINFVGFLEFLDDVRRCIRSDWRRLLRRAFDGLDAGRRGFASLQDCARLLGELGLSPVSREQQRRIVALLEVADKDGSGRYSFAAFEWLFERTSEMMQRIYREEECDMAASLELSKEQVEEYREAFHTFDVDDSGHLAVDEVRRLVDTLRISISGDLLNELIGKVDANKSGKVEFHEFLKLMHLVESRQRARATPSAASAAAAAARA